MDQVERRERKTECGRGREGTEPVPCSFPGATTASWDTLGASHVLAAHRLAFVPSTVLKKELHFPFAQERARPGGTTQSGLCNPFPSIPDVPISHMAGASLVDASPCHHPHPTPSLPVPGIGGIIRIEQSPKSRDVFSAGHTRSFPARGPFGCCWAIKGVLGGSSISSLLR